MGPNHRLGLFTLWHSRHSSSGPYPDHLVVLGMFPKDHMRNNIHSFKQQLSGRYPVMRDDRWLQSLDGRDGSAVIPIR